MLAWLQAVDNANLQLASVSLGEIQAGIEITREQDAAKASAWTQLMHRRSDTLYEDAMIAAIALVHGLTVVTRRQELRRFRCGTVQSLRVQGVLRAANRR